ncbi:MAG: DNA-binding protein [Bacteroidetes bacterium CG_4_10_14_3_um_filter_31_20]|nr:MAG: DNA-binding protein [Bacteroidetes bacterium CG_4_8_14_3_um_filter_31_14]PIY06829.1 MAG: DNA-binding protein [Bacteroidetes bacterium CG_4_10_14_3_um_filter_31_20]
MQLQIIQRKIYEIRGQKVILDFDIAELYGTETKYLKRAVRANIKRFPPDFLFNLSKEEWETLRCSFSTSNKRGGTRYLPFAFTEQGVAMLSSVLHSEKAVEVNIYIMRAFVFIRKYALSHKDLTEKLKKLERKYNRQFRNVYEALNYLMQKDKQETVYRVRKRIGFKTD